MSSSHTPHGHVAEQNLAGRPLVLVVHSSPSVRHALLVTLDLDGFDVLMARDGAEAVGLLTHTRPDVVIVDLIVADDDQGYLLRHLLTDAETEHMPIILFDQRTAVSRAGHFSVNGIHNVCREDGVSRLLAVLHQITDQVQPPDGDRPAA